MGIYAVLLNARGDEVRGLPDPAGGTFDAAGGFDRLLRQVEAAPVWSSIDPYGDTTLSTKQARSLAAELPGILGALQVDPDGPTARGLERLRVLAGACASDSTLRLLFIGD